MSICELYFFKQIDHAAVIEVIYRNRFYDFVQIFLKSEDELTKQMFKFRVKNIAG